MTTNWLKLQAVLAEPFGDRPDIQEAIARAVAFLEERSLDRPAAPRRRGTDGDGIGRSDGVKRRERPEGRSHGDRRAPIWRLPISAKEVDLACLELGLMKVEDG
jgi:hypothetical protein